MKLLILIALITYALGALTYTVAAAKDGTTETTCLVTITATTAADLGTDGGKAAGQIFYAATETIADGDPGLGWEATATAQASSAVFDGFGCTGLTYAASPTAVATGYSGATSGTPTATECIGICTKTSAESWLATAHVTGMMKHYSADYAASGVAMGTLATEDTTSNGAWETTCVAAPEDGGAGSSTSGADTATLLAGASALVGAVSFF